DWEVYAQLTERGVPIVGAPTARVYAQEARTLRQSAPKRRRWSGGKLTVLHLFWRPLLQSRHIGVRQKLDVIGEFLAPGPAVHLGVAGLLAVFAVVLRVPGATVLETLLAIGVGRQVVYALAALVNARDPFRAAAAFAFLPVYAIWRLGVELSALQMVGAAPWIRTERHRHRER
ncbi:MAG: hypothetical protein ACREOE_14425, partial [Gemmatimonadales bacterium]